jgi:hypothetical protein
LLWTGGHGTEPYEAEHATIASEPALAASRSPCSHRRIGWHGLALSRRTDGRMRASQGGFQLHHVTMLWVRPSVHLSTEATLRWRSQFALEPIRSFFGFHRIGQRDDALVNVIASTAFECSDVKARPAGGDPCQRCCCFALWTWWPVKRDHDASPWIRRERYRTLSHRQMP